ncbi:MAG: ATP synthase F1 subunit gamma [Bacteroidetes bacterium]|nr:ATP synthase F1 subunit gamma [Bacteroidota bacterium]
MPSLKEVRVRIGSVKSTQQITSAMKMVAASKLRRAQMAILKMRPFAAKMKEILQNLSVGMETTADSPFSSTRSPGKVLLVVFTSNRGLCGAFNANILKRATELIHSEYPTQLKTGNLTLMTVGKKASEYFRKRNFQVAGVYDHLYDHLTYESATHVSQHIMDEFTRGTYDQVVLIYNQFKNAAVQVLQVEQFLPVISSTSAQQAGKEAGYIYEPDQATIVRELIPRSLRLQFFKCLLDSFASEQGARMTAMQIATDNATELLKELKLTYNKARQASITKEILEIVSGAEALSNK